MKVLTTQQIREADQYTIANEPISSIDLMEFASERFTNKLLEEVEGDSFAIFCGVGNNGGDGLVVARLLSNLGKKVQVYVVEFSKNYSEDFKINLERLQQLNVSINFLNEDNFKFSIDENSIIIDAVFGSGIARPVDGFAKEVINQINNSSNTVVSIDSPSGLFLDNSQPENAIAVQADYTFTFQYPKLAFFAPENQKYVGEWSVIDIGLLPEFIEEQSSDFELVELSQIKSIYKQRNSESHKGDFGHALLVAGSKGKMGATILASKACLKSGTGLVSAHVPECGLNVLQTAIPEVMVEVDVDTDLISEVNLFSDKINAVGIGCGIGRDKLTTNALRKFIKKVDFPIVVDADAINIISNNTDLLDFLPENSILTPHFKEFERLVGASDNHFERLEKLKEFSNKYNLIVVLKGKFSAIAIPNNKIYFNSTGNVGMATAGSGDVLTGIITGLLAQCYSPKEAAILGAYLHGLAGDFALKEESEESLIASSITENLGKAYKTIVN